MNPVSRRALFAMSPLALASPAAQKHESLAGTATHYQPDVSHTRFTFYLRGHRQPSGIQAAGASVQPSHAQWSDGRPVMAHDFVYFLAAGSPSQGRSADGPHFEEVN
jgi:hypothetical protein